MQYIHTVHCLYNETNGFTTIFMKPVLFFCQSLDAKLSAHTILITMMVCNFDYDRSKAKQFLVVMDYLWLYEYYELALCTNEKLKSNYFSSSLISSLLIFIQLLASLQKDIDPNYAPKRNNQVVHLNFRTSSSASGSWKSALTECERPNVVSERGDVSRMYIVSSQSHLRRSAESIG